MILFPWGLKEILLISFSWPYSRATQAPVKTLYTLAIPSALAVANLLPVLLKHASRTSSL